MTEKLALLGGEPVTRRQWPFYHTIGEAEKAEVMEVLDSGILSNYLAAAGDRFLGGAKVRRLETDWAAKFKVPYAVASNSATSSLHSALVACGVGPGHEVIVPQLGMSAAAAVVLEVGALPVFADCDPHTMHIDPDFAARLINSRTKAILPVHLAGMPVAMDDILALAEKHNLAVIEDNAQAPGALYKGKFAGALGHVGCFSLNCHKIIQCGEGGVACTHDPDIALRLQLFRNHAEKCLPGFTMEKTRMWGLNLRLTELQAAVAIPQLAKLDGLNAKTQQLCQYVTQNLQLPGIIAPQTPPDRTHVYYLYHWEYRTAEVGVSASRFAQALQAEGLPVYAHYGYLISQLPPFADGGRPDINPEIKDRFPGACQAVENSLWTMMIRPHLDISDMDLLIRAMLKVYHNRRQL